MIERRFSIDLTFRTGYLIELTIWTGRPRTAWHRPTYASTQTSRSVGAVIAGVEPVLYWRRWKARP